MMDTTTLTPPFTPYSQLEVATFREQDWQRACQRGVDFVNFDVLANCYKLVDVYFCSTTKKGGNDDIIFYVLYDKGAFFKK